MKFLKETDPRFHLVDLKVRMFVLFAIVGTMVVLLFLGWRQEFFTPVASLRFVAGSSRGIQKGMAVKLSGFDVGKVRKIELDEQARVHVALAIYRKYMKIIKADSVARLTSESLVGDNIISILGGTAGSPPIADGSEIVFEREQSLAEVTDNLRAEIKPAIADLKGLLEYVNDPKGDLKLLLQHLNTVSATFAAEAPSTMKAVRDSADRSKELLGRLTDPGGDMQTTLGSLNRVSAQLEERLPALLDQTNRDLTLLEKTTSVIYDAAAKSAPKVPRLIDKSTRLSEGANEIVDVWKTIWPWSARVKKQQEKTIQSPSVD